MPSFDIVSKVDMQEVLNALNSVRKEMDNRYDFKGSKCDIKQSEDEITAIADDNYKLEQIQAMMRTHFTRRKIDAKSLDFQDIKKTSGNTVSQKIIVKQGISSEIAKKIIKEIKDTKIKVQPSNRKDEVRVEGKKYDDLQEIMSILKQKDFNLPLQFINFRD